MRRALLLWLVAAAALPAGAGAQGCGVDLSQPLVPRASGAICGTDEGDDQWLAGEDGGVTFFGENGHDTVEGSLYADSLTGGGGNDELHGGRGNDQLDGGDDSDVLFGGPGDDHIVERRFGFDHLYGGQGDDLLFAGRANDRAYGGGGNDTVYGGSGNDHLFGGEGDDVLYGGPGRDVYDCGPGNDTVHATNRQTVPGALGARDPFIRAAAGCEHIVFDDPSAAFPLVNRVGGDGDDVIGGWEHGDLLEGKGGADKLDGRAGDDELEGDGTSNQGGDLLIGGAGNDRVAGRAGNDRIFGDGTDAAGAAGNDELVGGAGRDTLVAGPGDDLAVGAYDGDRIIAGSGNDVVTLLGGDASDPNGTVYVNCGPGLDTVVINPARRGRYARCEIFADQFHEADHGRLLRASPVVMASASRARRAQLAEPAPAEPDGGAGPPSIDFDGDRIGFSSDAPNLIGPDANAERTDPFVRDLQSRRTIAVDTGRAGANALAGGRFRRGPAGGLSADGRYAVYSSRSPDLPGGPGYRILRHDLATGEVRPACRAGDDASESPAISPDGRYVAFESRAENLVGTDDNEHTDVYWCDLETRAMKRVSRPADDTVDAAGSSLAPAISAGGRYVVWTNDGGDPGVWWRDMQTGEARLVAREGDHPHISPDGRYVVYDAPDGDLVRVFRRDMFTGALDAVTPATDGDSLADSISADGNVIAFSSRAANLVEGDANGRTDVFVRVMSAGAVLRVSTRADGSQLDGPSYAGAISGDGRMVAFASRAPGVAPGLAATARARVYRKDLLTGAVEPATVGIDLTPRSLISEPLAGTTPRRKLRAVSGTTEDNGKVVTVDVAMYRRLGRGRCQWLLGGYRTTTDSCARPFWNRTRQTGGFRWYRRVQGHRLPRGNWTLRSRATDDTGRVEGTRPGLNRLKLRLG